MMADSQILISLCMFFFEMLSGNYRIHEASQCSGRNQVHNWRLRWLQMCESETSKISEGCFLRRHPETASNLNSPQASFKRCIISQTLELKHKYSTVVRRAAVA